MAMPSELYLPVIFYLIRGVQILSPNEIVSILVDLSIKKRVEGLLALQDDEDETAIVFLRQALGLLVDGFSKEQIRESLTSEMYFF